MSFDWNAPDGNEAAPMPIGTHAVKIAKVKRGSKKNGDFTTKNGDAQIMVIFADPQEREAALMITLSEKAGWVLRRLLGCCEPRPDFEKMNAAGVLPVHFAKPSFGDKNLVGKRLRIDVRHESGKEYPTITPIKAEGSPSFADGELPVPDEIPF